MEWKNKKLETAGDLMWGMEHCDTKEEAKQFMELYRAENNYADQNIGYLTGYYNPSEMKIFQNFFGVGHPIFKADITYESAYSKGVEMGKKIMEAKNGSK